MPSQLSSPPTISTSNLCSLGTDLAGNQILRVALQLGQPVLDTSIEFCGFTNRCMTTRLARSTNCPVGHGRWSVVPVEKPLAKTTLAELSKEAALCAGSSTLTFVVDGFNWIESGACPCAPTTPVCRFVAVERMRFGRCSKCRQPILLQPLYTHRAVTSALLGDAIKRPLGKLGAARARCLLVSNGDQSVLFREPNAQFFAS
jgi:hypothetical protein